jgi:hypothetical protein
VSRLCPAVQGMGIHAAVIPFLKGCVFI